MNERIKELINQATTIEVLSGRGFDETQYTERFSKEKFALLIVRECARRCEEIAIKHQVEETIYAAGKKAGAFECAADLKQHFGVK